MLRIIFIVVTKVTRALVGGHKTFKFGFTNGNELDKTVGKMVIIILMNWAVIEKYFCSRSPPALLENWKIRFADAVKSREF